MRRLSLIIILSFVAVSPLWRRRPQCRVKCIPTPRGRHRHDVAGVGVRHPHGLAAPDFRPAIVLDDVTNAVTDNIKPNSIFRK